MTGSYDSDTIAEAMKLVTVTTKITSQLGAVFERLGETISRARRHFAAYISVCRPVRPTPPARLAPGMPHCRYCYPPVEWARAQRMDRDRRRVYRRAMRRYKRTLVRPG